jgi:hypothetical protein
VRRRKCAFGWTAGELLAINITPKGKGGRGNIGWKFLKILKFQRKNLKNSKKSPKFTPILPNDSLF